MKFMDEKIYHDRIINKMHSNADKLISHKKEIPAAFDTVFIMNGFNDNLAKRSSVGISEIILALQKHADGSLMGIVNSLQKHTNGTLFELLDSIEKNRQEIKKTDNTCKGLKESRSHSYPKDNPPTVARLLGEVLSDFLEGLSKNESNLIVQNMVTNIASCFENIEFNQLSSSQSLLSILEFLSSPMCVTDEKDKASSDKIHQ